MSECSSASRQLFRADACVTKGDERVRFDGRPEVDAYTYLAISFFTRRGATRRGLQTAICAVRVSGTSRGRFLPPPERRCNRALAASRDAYRDIIVRRLRRRSHAAKCREILYFGNTLCERAKLAAPSSAINAAPRECILYTCGELDERHTRLFPLAREVGRLYLCVEERSLK